MSRVRRAVGNDINAIAELLGAAFSDYPWTRWCVDADDHVARITELQRIPLEFLGVDNTWVIEHEGALLSAAIWSDSRISVDSSLFVKISDRCRPWHGNRLQAAIVAESNGFARPSQPHLFLETMGTHPDHRRDGHGLAVLQPGLEIADADGLVCGLETSTQGNVDFYRTAGFEVVDHRVVDGGGPDVWTMWRSPQSAGAQ